MLPTGGGAQQTLEGGIHMLWQFVLLLILSVACVVFTWQLIEWVIADRIVNHDVMRTMMAEYIFQIMQAANEAEYRQVRVTDNNIAGWLRVLNNVVPRAYRTIENDLTEKLHARGLVVVEFRPTSVKVYKKALSGDLRQLLNGHGFTLAELVLRPIVDERFTVKAALLPQTIEIDITARDFDAFKALHDLVISPMPNREYELHPSSSTKTWVLPFEVRADESVFRKLIELPVDLPLYLRTSGAAWVTTTQAS